MNGTDMWDDEDRQVLAHLPFDEVAPPSGLEDRVMSAALTARPSAKRRSHSTRAVLAGLAAAAIIAAVVLVVVNNRTSTAPPTRIEPASATKADVDAALASSGARRGGFPDDAGRVVLTSSGRGYVYGLATNDVLTIDLQTATGTQNIGSARPQAGIIAFRVDHPERVQSVVLATAGQARRAALNG